MMKNAKETMSTDASVRDKTRRVGWSDQERVEAKQADGSKVTMRALEVEAGSGSWAEAQRRADRDDWAEAVAEGDDRWAAKAARRYEERYGVAPEAD